VRGVCVSFMSNLLEGRSKNPKPRCTFREMLEYMALNEIVVNCLRGAFENFFRFNKILCVNPEQESS